MTEYTPELTQETRDGKQALFIVSPDGFRWNVRDLKPSQCTEDVKRAIMNAFNLGMKAKAMLIKRAL